MLSRRDANTRTAPGRQGKVPEASYKGRHQHGGTSPRSWWGAVQKGTTGHRAERCLTGKSPVTLPAPGRDAIHHHGILLFCLKMHLPLRTQFPAFFLGRGTRVFDLQGSALPAGFRAPGQFSGAGRPCPCPPLRAQRPATLPPLRGDAPRSRETAGLAVPRLSSPAGHRRARQPHRKANCPAHRPGPAAGSLPGGQPGGEAARPQDTSRAAPSLARRSPAACPEVTP